MEQVMLISLGCPKNTVDSEIIAALLENEGFSMTGDVKEADAVVVNTCAFIQPAVEEAISVILEYAGLKAAGGIEKLVVAGCLTERYKDKIIEEIPEVDFCIGVDGITKIADLLRENFTGVSRNGYPEVDFLNLPRKLSDSVGTAYLKISEGCDNFCTYCMIPSIRGSQRSRTIGDIEKEAALLCSQNNVKELIIVAQDTTAYGTDIYGKPSLVKLLERLVEVEDLEWIRLLYCYPELIDDELVDLIAREEKILNYIDIPLQHASDNVLKLMGRKGTYENYTKLINKLRHKIDNMVIRTTFITGFPGETKKDFDILKKFVKQNRFDRLGVFPYYDEDKVPAYRLPGKVPEAVKQARRDEIMKMQNAISREINEARVGSVYDIIITNVADDGIFYEGRSYAEAPEIDGVVYVASERQLEPGEIVKVKILEAQDYDLIGVGQDDPVE